MNDKASPIDMIRDIAEAYVEELIERYTDADSEDEAAQESDDAIEVLVATLVTMLNLGRELERHVADADGEDA